MVHYFIIIIVIGYKSRGGNWYGEDFQKLVGQFIWPDIEHLLLEESKTTLIFAEGCKISKAPRLID